MASRPHSLKLPASVKAVSDRRANAADRSESLFAAQANRDSVEIAQWQVQEIQAALKEAEAGDFASAQELADLVRNWEAGAD